MYLWFSKISHPNSIYAIFMDTLAAYTLSNPLFQLMVLKLNPKYLVLLSSPCTWWENPILKIQVQLNLWFGCSNRTVRYATSS